MTGLKICTRCLPISARRRRRISSSLLPENIGPTITSIQPMLPFTMSTRSFPPSVRYHTAFRILRRTENLGSRAGRGEVHVPGETKEIHRSVVGGRQVDRPLDALAGAFDGDL